MYFLKLLRAFERCGHIVFTERAHLAGNQRACTVRQSGQDVVGFHDLLVVGELMALLHRRSSRLTIPSGRELRLCILDRGS